MKTELFYKSSEIRTADMLPLRSTDINFGDEVSLTKQSDAEACDINNIMAPYARVNMRELLNENPSQYLDLTDAKTYHESMNVVVQAQEAFFRLPAEIRKQFGNDPENFLEFANDEKNLPKMAAMGLIEDVTDYEANPDLKPSPGAAKRPQKADVAAPGVPPKGEAKDPTSS